MRLLLVALVCSTVLFGGCSSDSKSSEAGSDSWENSFRAAALLGESAEAFRAANDRWPASPDELRAGSELSRKPLDTREVQPKALQENPDGSLTIHCQTRELGYLSVKLTPKQPCGYDRVITPEPAPKG